MFEAVVVGSVAVYGRKRVSRVQSWAQLVETRVIVVVGGIAVLVVIWAGVLVVGVPHLGRCLWLLAIVARIGFSFIESMRVCKRSLHVAGDVPDCVVEDDAVAGGCPCFTDRLSAPECEGAPC